MSLFLCSCDNDSQSIEKSILIRNGTIINYDESLRADILIRGEKIVEMGADIQADKNTKIINASGLEILPGGIDPHVHVTEFVDDFISASKAALTGGITTLGETTFPKQGQHIEDRLKEVAIEIDSTSILDVIVTPTFPNASSDDQEVVQKIPAEGFTSLKIFTIFESFNNDVDGFSELLKISKKVGVLPMIHCEDFDLINQS